MTKTTYDVPKKLYDKMRSGEYQVVYEHGVECLTLPMKDVMGMWEELHNLRKASKGLKRKKKR